MFVPPFDAYLLYLVLAVLFVAFVLERMRNEVAAGIAVAALLLLGILRPQDVMSSFSNEAPITVACMFVLSAALERTGTIDHVGRYVTGLARERPHLSLALLMGGAMVISAFINNTPVVVILAPVTVMLAGAIGVSASKFLIPLSYATILGGTCTLIGTSTNLVVDGAARTQGIAPIGMFEISPAGVIYGLVGIAYMLLIGRHLLPDRAIFTEIAAGQRQRQFLADVLVPHGSPLVGKTLDQAQVASKLGTRVVDLIRNRVSIGPEIGSVTIEPGDRLVFRTNAADVLQLRAKSDVVFATRGEHALEPIGTQNTRIMEGVVGPRSPWVGRRLAALNLRRSFGAYILAVHRHGENLQDKFERVRLEFGDTLLLEGPPEGLQQLFEQGAIVALSEPADRPMRRDRRWFAVAAVASVVLLAALEVMPISALALSAAIFVVATGCLDADEAYTAINWPILMLIFAMLALGKSMETTGAGQMMVDALLTLVEGHGPLLVLAMVYFATMALTEFISNNAAAILITPIAIGVAAGLGVDPRPFVIAVMFAASASFSTPIGYQTNTFVYSAGGYRFVDFVRVGLPLNLLLWGVATVIIPIFWPLVPVAPVAQLP